MGFGFVGDELGEEEKGEDWDVKTKKKQKYGSAK